MKSPKETAKRMSWDPPGASRRLVIIPLLFLLLIISTLGFTIYAIQSFSEDTRRIEAVSRLRVMRSQYLNDVLMSVTQHPRDYQDSYRKMQEHLDTIRTGGRTRIGLDGQMVDLPPPPESVNPETLAINLALLEKLGSEAEKLLGYSRSDPGASADYHNQLSTVENVYWELRVANNSLLMEYMDAQQQHTTRLMWLATLLALLLGGFGILLTFQQQRVDREVHLKEQRFRQMFDNAPIGKVMVSLDGIWEQVNPAACHMLGYAESELIGRSYQEMTQPDDFLDESQIRQRLINGDIETYQVTKRYIHRDGHAIWTLSSVAAVKDPNCKPIYLVEQLLDITEQRAALESVRASETKFRSVIESATDGIVVANKEGIIISANTAASRMFGYEDRELLNQPLTRLMPERYKHRHSHAYQRMFETGKPALAAGHPLELEARHRNGHEFPIEISVAAWHDPSGEMFATGIIRDTTERKRAELERQELLRSNKDLEEFAIIASHDLQEPLRKISVFAERLVTRMNGNMDEQSSDYVRRIRSSTSRMQNLISDLLTYSRVTSKARPFEPVNLTTLVQDMVAEIDLAPIDPNALIEVGKLCTIEADPGQMRQLFQNLLENAIKYRREGVSLRIHIHGKLIDDLTSVEKTTDCQIMVEDNGIGFDEKYLDRIFNVFQRLHARDQYEGTGIGLATCRRIVERHHGRITAVSKPGVGSTFIVTLPVKQPEQEGLLTSHEIEA